jgi:putative transposase
VIEETRDGLEPGDRFYYYADEFNLSWMPTLKVMWSPKGRQVMIPSPAQPKKRYAIGAVDYHTGETVVLIRRRKRRPEVAELLEALLEKHPTGKVYVAWDNSNTHEDDEIEAVLRGAAGRLVLLYLPTYSPWLNPIEMLWRHFRREVTHCELFPSVKGSSRRPTTSSSATTGDLATCSPSLVRTLQKLRECTKRLRG